MTEKNICNLEISLNELREILNKEKIDKKSPYDYLIKNSEYELRVGENLVDVTFKINLIALNNDLMSIDLLPENRIVKSLKVNKGKVGFDGSNYSFWCSEAGEYTIEANYTLVVNNLSELKNVNITLLTDSKVTLFLGLKDEYKISHFHSLSEKSNKVEKQVEFYAKSHVDRYNNLGITWGNLEKKVKKEKVVEILDPIIHSVIETSINITDTSIIYNTKIDYKVYHSSIAKLELEVKDAQIITINGDYIKTYDIFEKNDKFYATIYFEREIEGEYTLNIYSEHDFSVDKDEFVIANFSILNAEREEGSIALSSKTITDMEILELDDIRSIDINELPTNLKNISKTKEAFKFLKTPYFAKVKLIKHKEVPMMVSMINNAIFNTVLLKKGLVLNSVYLEMKNNNKLFLEIKLPENTFPLSSFIKGKPTKPIKGKNGNMMLSLPKFTSSEEYFWIEMVFLTKFDKMKKNGELKVLLPEIDTAISHLYWKLFLPDKFKYKNFRGNIEKLDYFKTNPPFPPNNNPFANNSNYPAAEAHDPFEDDFVLHDSDEEDLCKSQIQECGAMPNELMDEMYFEKEMQEEVPVQAPVMKSKKARRRMSQVASTSAGSVMPKPRMPQKSKKMNLFSQKQFGKIPVKIEIPIVGNSNYFEKLFIENEQIELNFSYKKTKKDEVETL